MDHGFHPSHTSATRETELTSFAPQPAHSFGTAASPVPSRGPTSGRNCYITPAFSGVPKQGDKIRIGCLTPTFFGAQKRAEMLCNHCASRGPQQRGQNQNWVSHPCLLGGLKVSGNATEPLRSRGSPKEGTNTAHVELVEKGPKGRSLRPSLTKKIGSLRTALTHTVSPSHPPVR